MGSYLFGLDVGLPSKVLTRYSAGNDCEVAFESSEQRLHCYILAEAPRRSLQSLSGLDFVHFCFVCLFHWRIVSESVLALIISRVR